MSAAPNSALANSQAMPKPNSFKEYEDPARSWIDLVTAFKSGDPAKVREVMEQAKRSHWTHDLYNEALQEDEVSTDEEDGDGSGDWDEMPAHGGGWDNQQGEFYEE